MENKQNLIYIGIGVIVLIAVFYFFFYRQSEAFTPAEVTLVLNYMNSTAEPEYKTYLDFITENKVLEQKWYKPDTFFGLQTLKKTNALNASNITTIVS